MPTFPSLLKRMNEVTWACEYIREQWRRIQKKQKWLRGMTDRPREVWTRSVTKVEVAGQTQLRANMAYLNSSSQTTWSGKKPKNLKTVWVYSKWSISLGNLLMIRKSSLTLCLSGLDSLTCKFHMEFIFRFENLNIKGAVWSKILHRPGSQDGLVVLEGAWKDKALSLLDFQCNLL